MKILSKILPLLVVSAALLDLTGCVVQDPHPMASGARRRAPYVGSPEWLTWADLKVDTRYANGNRPDPGTQEWYAIVDHVVFSDASRDYYRSYYHKEYSEDYQRYYRTSDGTNRRYNYATNDYNRTGYNGAYGHYSSTSGFRLGTPEWRRAVTDVILSGKVPPPPPRSDPWDTPLAPASDR